MKTDDQRIEDLEGEVKEIRDSNTEMAANVKDIRDALLGTAFNDNQGIVSQVKDFAERIELIEQVFLKFKWVVIGLAMGAGIGAKTLIEGVVELFLNHHK